MTSAEKQAVGTTAPRWTEPGDRSRGLGRHSVRLPDELVHALREVGPPLWATLSAAHARVMATVTAEGELLVGYLAPGATALSARRLPVVKSTWAELVTAVEAADRVDCAGLVEGADRVGGECEIVFDLAGLMASGSPVATPGAVVRVVFAEVDGLWLTVEHDRALVDDEYAARLAGYHLTALRALAADPAVPHHRVGLLGDAEMETQLYGLAGHRVELPRTTFHELFEERVRTHPERVAATHGGHRRTYGELNAAANRIAHALIAEGVRAEDPVAVVLDRTLDWVAAALGVFKAGGVYLPVRPDFPADRVATQLARSSCRFVLTEPGSDDMGRRAVATAGVHAHVLSVPDVLAGNGPDTDPHVAVAPEQAAYTYFTSGSTGAPKGAVCEHAGMLNHLFMKVEDMGMVDRDGEVVTQTASQCFDISLWQFAAPLLVGGSVRLVDTDVLLTVDGFVDELVECGATVAQVVPSYLDVLLRRLERHPRPLGRLRSLSVTGEALKLELVQRWLAAYPDITLVNAYGATEVSDDTMHEFLDRLPARDFVTVGDSRRNVDTYIVDENLALVPLGSPGEITFSGVCVGRGYINDEELTRQSFVADPFRSNTRMYRTGDFGRWLPEGRIEFLGRRDEQVKIRGFRIEIGEIESRLLTVPGVRESAVVVDTGVGELRNLVAFFSGDDLQAAQLRDFLAGLLPEYMVPTYFHHLPRLPLTENGKVDKKVLTRLAGTLGHGWAAYVAPTSPTEQRLATVWAEVLGVPLERIGRDDDFFELGGTSLAAVRMLVGMNGELSLRQLVGNPRLGALASALDGQQAGTEVAQAGLVAPLSTVTNPHHALVCFPYAGGNAVNFRSLATELQRDGVAVYGVEPPGHDLAGEPEPMIDVARLAQRVAEEIREHVTTPLLLWGHCAGAAAALETARLLAEAGRPVERVFVGALLVEGEAELRREMADVESTDNVTLLDRLRADSAYVQLDGLQPERVDVVGSAYRHDVVTTNLHLMDMLDAPQRYRIDAPLAVVAARDDPTTPGYQDRYGDWKLVADHVELHEVVDGGHYFAGSRPGAVADLVRAACGSVQVLGCSHPVGGDHLVGVDRVVGCAGPVGDDSGGLV
jgi:amino acid adenylation domain-containing protein